MNREHRSLMRPLIVLGSVLLFVVLIAGVVSSIGSGRAAVHVSGGKPGDYRLTGFRSDEALHFTISANASRTLYPGTASRIDFSFTNPNSSSVTVPAADIKITMTSPRKKECPARPNFKIIQTLTKAVTVPRDSRKTLTQLSVPLSDWPMIKMVTTHVTQDPCQGMTLTLHYSTRDDDNGR